MFAFSSFDRRHGKIGVLDLDVTPTVCVEQAELGSLEELLEYVSLLLLPLKIYVTCDSLLLFPCALRLDASELVMF